jgi:hypothetical protein
MLRAIPHIHLIRAVLLSTVFAAAWLAIVVYLSHRVTHDYTPGIVVGVSSVAWFVWWALHGGQLEDQHDNH